MALVVADRVQQTGTANTTVSFTLSGSVTGFQSFSVIGDTNTTYYAATDASGNWEVGIGTYSTTGPTLTRTTILSSSNAGSAVTFSGTVNVFVTYPSERSVYSNGTNIVPDNAAILLPASGGTGLSSFTANGVVYASSTSALATGSALTFNGTNLTTTGSATATAFIPSSATVPTNGLYLPAANTVGISTNTTERMSVASTGQFTFTVEDMISSSPSAYNFRSTGKAAQTGTYTGLISTVNTDATYTGAGSVIGVYANQGTFTVAPTNAYGFYVSSGWVEATNNYGFYSNIDAGTGRWNFYTGGTADNYFEGDVGIGTTAPDYRLDVTSTDNVTTTIAMSVQNSSRNYGLGIGAYTMSNRNIGGTATTVDYTFDIGGAAIFKTNGTERMRIDSAGNVGIGRTAEAGYILDIANPDTASGADTFVRISSSASAGDADAEFVVESKGSGEAILRLKEDGVSKAALYTPGDGDSLIFANQLTVADLSIIGADTTVLDPYSVRYSRPTGASPVTGITGTITSSANTSTITGLSTTTGLVIGMILTKAAGTGVLGTQACIQSIDSASQITVTNGFAALTAGSITFTATPIPTTITVFAETASSTWTVDQDFARFGFANSDGTGAGDGGIKASINAYVYDVAGTGAGLDFYVSTNGTTLTKALRMTETGTLTSQATYDNTAAGSTVIVTSAGLIRRTSSSLKYKKDVEDLDSLLVSNAVDNLRPVWYRTKNAAGDDKETWSHIGLIAEEVHTVEPRLVRYRTVEVTKDENEKNVETLLDIPEPEDVDYGRLAVLLLAEVKSLKASIAVLKDRIAVLEAK